MLVSPSADAVGTLGDSELDRVVARDALGEVEAGRTGVRHYGPQGQTTPEDLIDTPTVRVFIEAFSPPPTMWIFGAVDFTAALAKVAKVLGYYVVVCDAREVLLLAVVFQWPTKFWSRGQHRYLLSAAQR